MIKWTDYKSQRTVIKWTHNTVTIRKRIAINQNQRRNKFVEGFSGSDWRSLAASCGVLLRRPARVSAVSSVNQDVHSCPNCYYSCKITQEDRTNLPLSCFSAWTLSWWCVFSNTSGNRGVNWCFHHFVNSTLLSVSLCGEKPSLRSLPQPAKVSIDTTPLWAHLTRHCWEHHHHNHAEWPTRSHSQIVKYRRFAASLRRLIPQQRASTGFHSQTVVWKSISVS